MDAKRYDQMISRLLWDPEVRAEDYLVVYEDRRAPHGLRAVRASQLDPSRTSRTGFALSDGPVIPLHLLREIRDLRTGNTIAGARMELPADGEPFSDSEPVRNGNSSPKQSRVVQDNGIVPAFSDVEVGVRAAFPEIPGDVPWSQILSRFSEVGAVEVAFHRVEPFLERVNLRDVVEPLARAGMRASSVHMPHARVRDPGVFTQVLKQTLRIAEALECKLVVAHPSHGKLSETAPFIAREVTPLLQKAGVVLCWETFSGSRRFLNGIQGIAALCRENPWHRACYDTSHLHKSQEGVLQDIHRHAHLIRCFHLSNRRGGNGEGCQHLPVRHPEGDLDFTTVVRAIAASGFAGSVTLEYLPQYHDQLVEDALWLRAALDQACG